ncbi:ras guanine-nucleotide exchange factor [Colletotrichum tofieldiae]|uniref:Ras guanine-nucleotide exchange factor n=1 Tax=Colletotrichum tofieldiae TaxID=708197 RepID=A0A161VNS4_9PEZI|nr:Ras guanine-nucleotide exchange factor [Colletotrichum tofieldiae]GKT66117.1 Ras guanine-nucleotide exchange factor [Colletotrichum tofieldiae]GKT70711.1 ras guanine-nucleotide exchange factor [Colletotrichum tofieldiae]
MVMLSDHSMRASLQVAPLKLHKSRSCDALSSKQDQYSSNSYPTTHMTPPATPNGSQEDLAADQMPPPVFHNFLRAFYPFHPSYAMTDSSVTLPLNEGDVILVHSIHTNGWADGTLLVSGARGWLPTNYCEAYDPEEMRNLLKALLNFWDLLRSTSVNDSEIFGNQEFMKGIIAGVRYLLERTHCLTRESAIITRNDSLRRARKTLLSELSALVKTAKRLQEAQKGVAQPREDVNDIIDEMILKAFKIVTKGVRFFDILEDDRRQRAPAVTVMATVIEESYIPPTPPADHINFDETHNAGSRGPTNGTPTRGTPSQPSDAAQTTKAPPTGRRLSTVYSPASPNSHRMSQNVKRLSSNISHRVSLAGPSPLSRPHHLVSERLNKSHDTFLSHLGSFIGRLHLQSQSRPELAFAIKLSATSGGELLAVVDVVCGQSTNSEMLARARDMMFERIRELVTAAGQIIRHAVFQDADVIMPQDNSMLLMAATGCVKAAGECVAKTKWAIERVGDFECEFEAGDLGIDLSVLDLGPEPHYRRPSVAPSVAETTTTEATSVAESTRSSDSVQSVVPPTPHHQQRPSIVANDKPLPQLPQGDDPEAHQVQRPRPSSQNSSAPNSRPSSLNNDNVSSVASSISSMRPTLPPLPKLSTSLLPGDEYSPIENTNQDGDYNGSSRVDSMAVSSAGSSSTYLSRDSEASLVSQTSTRATTPDHTLAPKLKPSMSELSNAGSANANNEEVDDVESKMLEKTYAHELMFNKEGQVTGGSLAALVERLTTHESTPDATFVSTFYLTFRLFCSPLKLAETLIDRFHYVAEAPHMAGPVRLRVYNAFKGWLESHWRDETDREALALIEPFAQFELGAVLPSAGRRLLELAQRVSKDIALVPRLVSSMGKTNTSIAQYIPADTPHPALAITKSQIHQLFTWKNGGSNPTILDFEPLEIARQLTIKQMTIFCSIMPEELLASQWMKKRGVDAPNVKAMSALSTDLSNLVAETILQYSEVKKRAAVIKQWIKVAHQCLELHNYDGLMAIICSLNSSTISRLRKTWDFVSVKRREMLRTLQAIVEPAQNNKVLRTRLHDHVPPCLPFLGMFLTDLTFVDIGNPATKQIPTLGGDGCEENGGGLTVVNFDKHTRTAKIIGELQRFQIPYRLTEIPEMQEWMTAQIVRVRESDQGNNVQVSYYRKSLLLEPREMAARAPIEPQTSATGTQRGGDLFGWMSRDRGAATPTPM